MVFTSDMLLGNRYRLLKRIGLGGMSEVWRATDELLGRPVAIKALASPLATNPALRAGTRREARAAARLTHPYVTQVYDYGEVNLSDGPPTPYLVMELVDGQNLADRLDRGPLPWRDAARIAAQVAAGLAAAHRLGVVHRDIKPGNVMLTTTGAKILDFGIAALTGARPESDTGLLIGTPAYAAPELLRTDVADPAGDVYGLGALFYQCLTGRTPLGISTWTEATAARQRADRPAAPRAPGLPEEVAALCLACLATDPRDRPGANEVATRLARAAGGPDATPAGPVPTRSPTVSLAAHPPTLIDRSLTGSARTGPARTGPAVGSASAAVRVPDGATFVHRAGAPGPESDGPDIGRRSRLAIVAGTGAVIAAGLTLALIAAAFRAQSTPTGLAEARTPAVVTPSTSPADTGSPPAATKETPAWPGLTADDEIVDQLDQLLTDAVGAGQLSDDVARDLRDKLKDLRKDLGKGKLRKKVADLRDKVEEYLEDGEIDHELANRIKAALQLLLTINDPGGGRDDD